MKIFNDEIMTLNIRDTSVVRRLTVPSYLRGRYRTDEYHTVLILAKLSGSISHPSENHLVYRKDISTPRI